jgi:predicted outer membrane repeat protein
MYLDHTSPTVIDCVFRDNQSRDDYVYSANGGAIYITGGSPAIDSCAFNNNYAEAGGGAIYCKNFSDTIITNCTFNSNYSMKGGAISNTSSSHMAISLCSFVGNNATFYGGSIYHLDSQNMTISDCSFTANFASSGGGTSSGGAIYLQNAAIDISQSTFSSNVADLKGGGVATTNSQAVISGSEFGENSADVGGAISFNNAFDHETNQIGNTLFCGNESSHVSGGWTDLGGNEFFDTCNIGACCTNDICVLIDQSTCTFVGGEFQGREFACGDVECSESSCPGDLNSDGVVDITDVLGVIGGWGVCP